MKRLLPLFLLLALAIRCSVAQDQPKYAGTITEQSSREHLTLLTSKEFEGRGTGQPGGQKTADYIADHFKQYDLKPLVNGTYFQPVALLKTSYKVNSFKIQGTDLVYGRDLFAVADNALENFDTKEIVFVGYGIQDPKYNELKGLNIQGKTVLLINDGEPLDPQGNSVITGTQTLSEWSSNRFKRIQALLKLRPKMILATGNGAEQLIKESNDRGIDGVTRLDDQVPTQKRSTSSAPVIYLTESAANRILKQIDMTTDQFRQTKNQSHGKPYHVNIPTDIQAQMGFLEEKLTDPNVLGLVEGSDLKNEILVICGHYDHDGILPDGTFFRGADDNGSGTVAVLELAKAFAKARKEGKGPRRSILFIGLAAEEKGLLGSKYYVQHPILPLDSTIACLNIDMIGRIDDKHLEGNHDYIHVIGTNKLSSDLKSIVEEANKSIGLELDDTYNDPKDPQRLYYRSDHYNFAQKGIPSLFFFSGLHPHYHTPEDTADKIDYSRMVKRQRLLFHVARDIANRDQRPKVDIPE